MKSRLFVVNSETLKKTKETNIASIIMPSPTGTQWIKTLADIMSDMLQIEIGDYIFYGRQEMIIKKAGFMEYTGLFQNRIIYACHQKIMHHLKYILKKHMISKYQLMNMMC